MLLFLEKGQGNIMVKMSRKMIWAVLFIVVVAVGTFILVWLSRSGNEDTSYQIQDPEEKAAAVEDIPINEEEQEEPPKTVPKGMKEVNLPVSFFGDYAVLNIGDKVDIISTHYKEEAGSLFSERIIIASEIIRLEDGRDPEVDDSLLLGDAFIYEGISGTGTAIDMGNILIMTFFLTDDEVLKSFTALESGMLYVALCPAYSHSEWGND
jgi:hypothetical protein